MTEHIPDSAASMRITVVVDNAVDIFLPSGGPFAYPQPGPASSLLAEQGLSLWIETTSTEGETARVLYDFGRGQSVLLHNLGLLELDPASADYLVLSHGHIDHYGCLMRLLERGDITAPLLAHQKAFGVRGVRRPDGKMAGPWQLEREPVGQALSQPILEADQPRQLGPGLWTSGSIEQNSPYDRPFLAAMRQEDGQWVSDDFSDEQAIFVRLEGRGVVVITGCCHAGAFNTLDAARAMFPDEPLLALVGGLHLNFLPAEELKGTVSRLQDKNLEWLLPLHCTGKLAKHMLRDAYGERCAFNTVGMSFTL